MAEISYLNQSKLLDPSKARLIVDSYNSMRTYVKNDAYAKRMIIQDSNKAFGFELDEVTFNMALQYVKNAEGRIASEHNDKIIKRLRSENEKEGRTLTLEDMAKSPSASYATANGTNYRSDPNQAYAKVTPITQARSYGVQKQALDTTNNDIKVNPIRGLSNHYSVDSVVNNYHKPSRFGTGLKRIAASIVFSAYLLNPFSGLMPTTKIDAAQVSPYSATTQAQIEKQESIMKRLDELKRKKEEKAKVAAPAAPPVAPTPTPTVTPAPTAPAPTAPTPTTPAAKKDEINLETYVNPYKDHRWVYEHRTPEHDKFQKREIKFKDLPSKVQVWYSLQKIKDDLKKEDSKYTLSVLVPTSYKGSDLGEYVMGIKVLGKWVYLEPNTTRDILLTKSQYDTLKASKYPIPQWKMLKVKETEKILHIFASEKKPKKAKVAKVPKPKVEKAVIAEVKIAPKPSVEDNLGPDPFKYDHLRGM